MCMVLLRGQYVCGYIKCTVYCVGGHIKVTVYCDVVHLYKGTVY